MNALPNYRRTIDAVITLAVEVINKPATLSRIPAITILAEQVDTERTVMNEGGPVIRGEVVMLLDALGHIEAERMAGSTRSREWSVVAFVLLQMTQDNLVAAITRELRGPSTSDGHDFRRRG